MAAMGYKELWDAIQRLRKGRARTKVQTASMSEEVTWRLRQIASHLGVSPGEVIEVLIRDTVLAFRLSWDTVGRLAMGSISAPDGGKESQESPGNGEGETLPIGETSHVPPVVEPGATPGAGEGSQAPPAPAARKRRTG